MEVSLCFFWLIKYSVPSIGTTTFVNHFVFAPLLAAPRRLCSAGADCRGNKNDRPAVAGSRGDLFVSV